MKYIKQLVTFTLLLALFTCQGKTKNNDFLNMKWRHVATRMPFEWYGSEEARQCAENVLIAQKNCGGWAKNKPFHHPFSRKEKHQYLHTKDQIGATIDNRATTSEIRFLAKVYAHSKNEKHRSACQKAINYLLEAQYDNGGWPQFYPLKGGYANHITYNDDAMADAMLVLKDVYQNSDEFRALKLSEPLKERAHTAFDKGVACILKTQIKVDGQPTVWCAQHDEVTFEPAKARSYELVSFSGAESAKIVQLLMAIENPSEEIKTAIEDAVAWFKKHQIEGIKRQWVEAENGLYNKVIVADKNAPLLWARFYDLETEKPYFCDRDGIKKEQITEIGFERRNGYSWYTDLPQQVIDAYPQWKKKNRISH